MLFSLFGRKTNWSYFAITNKFIVQMCATTVCRCVCGVRTLIRVALSVWTLKYLWKCILLNVGTSRSCSFNIFRLISCCHRNLTQTFSFFHSAPSTQLNEHNINYWRTHYFVTKSEKNGIVCVCDGENTVWIPNAQMVASIFIVI